MPSEQKPCGRPQVIPRIAYAFRGREKTKDNLSYFQRVDEVTHNVAGRGCRSKRDWSFRKELQIEQTQDTRFGLLARFVMLELKRMDVGFAPGSREHL
jgi:hypothetical protein